MIISLDDHLSKPATALLTFWLTIPAMFWLSTGYARHTLWYTVLYDCWNLWWGKRCIELLIKTWEVVLPMCLIMQYTWWWCNNDADSLSCSSDYFLPLLSVHQCYLLLKFGTKWYYHGEPFGRSCGAGDHQFSCTNGSSFNFCFNPCVIRTGCCPVWSVVVGWLNWRVWFSSSILTSSQGCIII